MSNWILYEREPVKLRRYTDCYVNSDQMASESTTRSHTVTLFFIYLFIHLFCWCRWEERVKMEPKMAWERWQQFLKLPSANGIVLLQHHTTNVRAYNINQCAQKHEKVLFDIKLFVIIAMGSLTAHSSAHSYSHKYYITKLLRWKQPSDGTVRVNTVDIRKS